MRKILALIALAGALAGCQGILGANGQVTGFTVPPGCKGSYTFTWPMPQGSIMGSCDETGERAPAPAAMPIGAMMARPVVSPGGAHVTIDRQ
ncbi:MAG: hypothetical protein ACREFA_07640 [Stellaceae bacterium]